MRTYRIIIVTVWVLTLLITAIWTALHHSHKRVACYSKPSVLIITFIICGCYFGIWRKFRRGNNPSKQQNENLRNKRLTKTLLFVSILALLCWIPVVVLNGLISVHDIQIPHKFLTWLSLKNNSNSFANPVLFTLRIPEFREALVLCCLRRPAALNMVNINRRNDKTPAAELRTLRADKNLLQLKFK